MTGRAVKARLAACKRARMAWEFERDLKNRAPRSTDPLEWALYNQRVDRLRTEQRIRAEKENFDPCRK